MPYPGAAPHHHNHLDGCGHWLFTQVHYKNCKWKSNLYVETNTITRINAYKLGLWPPGNLLYQSWTRLHSQGQLAQAQRRQLSQRSSAEHLVTSPYACTEKIKGTMKSLVLNKTTSEAGVGSVQRNEKSAESEEKVCHKAFARHANTRACRVGKGRRGLREPELSEARPPTGLGLTCSTFERFPVEISNVSYNSFTLANSRSN